MSARPWYLIFFNSWKSSVLSSQDTVSSSGYTDHRSISGQRFERVTFFRKFYGRSFIGLFCKFLDSFNRLECVEVFVFVSSLTKLMNFGQTFLVGFSLSSAHIYGAICIAIVIEQPMCQICRKGQQVVHGPEKKIQLKRLLFPQHLSG